MHILGLPPHVGTNGSQLHGNQKGDDETSPPPTTPTDPVDITTLSKEAAAVLAADEGGKIRGNSANSPAHRAKAMIAEKEALGITFEGANFGQLVSRLAHEVDADVNELFSDPSLTEGEEEGDSTTAAILAVEPDGDETPPPGDGADPAPEVDQAGDDPLIDLLSPPTDPTTDPLDDPVDGTV